MLKQDLDNDIAPVIAADGPGDFSISTLYRTTIEFTFRELTCLP